MFTTKLGVWWILIAIVFMGFMITYFIIAPCSKSHEVTYEEYSKCYKNSIFESCPNYGDTICDSRDFTRGVNVNHPTIVTVLTLFVIAELLFLFDKRKISKGHLMEDTLIRKLECWFEATIIFYMIFFVEQTFRFIGFGNVGNFFIQAFKWILIVAGAISIIFIYIWINSLRMKRLVKRSRR